MFKALTNDSSFYELISTHIFFYLRTFLNMTVFIEKYSLIKGQNSAVEDGPVCAAASLAHKPFSFYL